MVKKVIFVKFPNMGNVMKYFLLCFYTTFFGTDIALKAFYFNPMLLLNWFLDYFLAFFNMNFCSPLKNFVIKTTLQWLKSAVGQHRTLILFCPVNCSILTTVQGKKKRLKKLGNGTTVNKYLTTPLIKFLRC